MKTIDKIAKALAKEVDCMAQEFTKARQDGTLNLDQWTEFEVADPLPGKINYTMMPKGFYRRLALAALRVVAPCPECQGTGYGPIAPDFIGDESGTMTIGTCSACQLCGGTGVDLNYERNES